MRGKPSANVLVRVDGHIDQGGNCEGGGKGYLGNSDTAFTLSTTQDQSLFTDMRVRRLTPIECERLQGFPDDWTAGQADSTRYKMMGNAVTVPVVEWIVDRMVKLVVE